MAKHPVSYLNYLCLGEAFSFMWVFVSVHFTQGNQWEKTLELGEKPVLGAEE